MGIRPDRSRHHSAFADWLHQIHHSDKNLSGGQTKTLIRINKCTRVADPAFPEINITWPQPLEVGCSYLQCSMTVTAMDESRNRCRVLTCKLYQAVQRPIAATFPIPIVRFDYSPFDLGQHYTAPRFLCSLCSLVANLAWALSLPRENTKVAKGSFCRTPDRPTDVQFSAYIPIRNQNKNDTSR